MLGNIFSKLVGGGTSPASTSAEEYFSLLLKLKDNDKDMLKASFARMHLEGDLLHALADVLSSNTVLEKLKVVTLLGALLSCIFIFQIGVVSVHSCQRKMELCLTLRIGVRGC